MTDLTATITRLRELIEDAGGPRRWRYLSMEHHIDIDWCGYEDDDTANLYVNVGHILIDGEPTEATKDHARSRLIVGALNALPALLDALAADEARLDWLEQCWVRVQCGSGLNPAFLNAAPPKWPFHHEAGHDWLMTKGPGVPLRTQIDQARAAGAKP